VDVGKKVAVCIHAEILSEDLESQPSFGVSSAHARSHRRQVDAEQAQAASVEGHRHVVNR